MANNELKRALDEATGILTTAATKLESGSENTSNKISANLRDAFPYLSQRNIQHRSQSAYLNSNLPLYHIKETWTHEFCCLPSTDQIKTPSASQTEALKQAGLGKTKIVYKNKLASHSEVCNILEEHFTQLKNCGGFTLHRANAGGQNRPLFDLQVTWFDVRSLKKAVLSSVCIYVRPLQRNLDLTAKKEKLLEWVTHLLFVCKSCKLKNLPNKTVLA